MEKKSWVHLISQNKYEMNEIFDELEKIFIKEKIDVKNKTVILKPSFVFPLNNKEHLIPINTNNAVIVAVCKILGKNGAKKIFIAESETILVSRYSFDMVDIKKDLKELSKETRKKIKFCYLDESYKISVTPENPAIPGIKFDYPKIVKDVDLFISLPKVKCNMFAQITLSAKNNMGLISTKNRLKHHADDLHEMISDLYQIRPPELLIVDAISAGEGQGPQMATPYPTNILIVGNNGPAVDSVSCELMGFNPHEIRHLSILESKNFGTLDLNKIRIENRELIEQQKHIFIRPTKDLSNLSPNIKVFKGECCESGCEAFIRGILEAWGLYFGWESIGELNIIMGKNLEISKEDLKKLKRSKTIVYGDCVEKYKKYGLYKSGCPPVYLIAAGYIQLIIRTKLPAWVKYSSVLKLYKNLFLFSISRLTGRKYKTI
ncbi:MAG: DUF362 domain-containing protein [archaeon]|nr:DUF362 domain-containing protein [archaeon]